jgi:hypothetical protein
MDLSDLTVRRKYYFLELFAVEKRFSCNDRHGRRNIDPNK